MDAQHLPPTSELVAILKGLSAEALQRRLAELDAEADTVRLLLRAAVRRERAEQQRGASVSGGAA